MTRRLALVVGDTPGHFYPAVAVAEAYRRLAGDVVFFGPRGVGADLAARHGCAYQRVSGGPLKGVGVAGRIAAGLRSVAGVAQARRALGDLGTRLVIGFGGYASGPVLLGAGAKGICTAILEPNLRPGLANRLLARTVDRVYLRDAETDLGVSRDRVRVIGWPVRSEVRALMDLQREPPAPARPVKVLVCGGSRGAAFLDREIPPLLERVAAAGLPLEIRHQSPDAASAAVVDAYARVGIAAVATPYIDDMADAYRWADFVIARGGAGTLAELAAAALPSLLVPLPAAADDHQAANADAFVARGAALAASEDAWPQESLAAQLTRLLGDRAAWQAMSDRVRQLAAPDAATALVNDCEMLMEGRW